MNALEFAILRFARQRMTAAELAEAKRLAVLGDKGDAEARKWLRLECCAIAAKPEEDEDGTTGDL